MLIPAQSCNPPWKRHPAFQNVALFKLVLEGFIYNWTLKMEASSSHSSYREEVGFPKIDWPPAETQSDLPPLAPFSEIKFVGKVCICSVV
jgi:hypothetical protein